MISKLGSSVKSGSDQRGISSLFARMTKYCTIVPRCEVCCVSRWPQSGPAGGASASLVDPGRREDGLPRVWTRVLHAFEFW